MKRFMGKGGLILVLILTIANSVSVFAAQGTTTVANGDARKLTPEEAAAFHTEYENINVPKYSGKGFAYDDCPTLDENGNKRSEVQIKDLIYEVTKLNITSQLGILYLEDEAKWIEDQELVSAEKTTLPETKKTEFPFSKSWNGIRNFLFPNTYYAEGSFSTSADGAHRVKIYAADGAYAATIDAVQRDGKYVTDISVEDNDYYTVIFNGIEGTASNATYTVK